MRLRVLDNFAYWSFYTDMEAAVMQYIIGLHDDTGFLCAL